METEVEAAVSDGGAGSSEAVQAACEGVDASSSETVLDALGAVSVRLSRRLSVMAQSLMLGEAGADEEAADGGESGEGGGASERRPSGSHLHPLHVDETLEEELEAHPEESVQSVQFLTVTAIVHKDGEQEVPRPRVRV